MFNESITLYFPTTMQITKIGFAVLSQKWYSEPMSDGQTFIFAICFHRSQFTKPKLW